MESLSEYVLEDREREQLRIALMVEEILDDEGWELDIEFTPEGFADLPVLLNEFLGTQEVSPEARVQLEVLGRLVKRAAGAAGRVTGEWQKARARVRKAKSAIRKAKSAIRKSFEAGKQRAYKSPAKPAAKPAAKRRLKPGTRKRLSSGAARKPAVKKPAVKKPAVKQAPKRKLGPGEKMVFGKVRKVGSSKRAPTRKTGTVKRTRRAKRS